MDFLIFLLTLGNVLLTFPENITCLRFRRAAIRGCSHSLESVKEGYGCPVNKSEWEKRAEAMKCENYSQNCTDDSSFVYHCLINPWSNGTIEVCAPRIKIFGNRCAEFNIGGVRVQTHYKKPCQLCPRRYNSSESYKYQECYKLVKTPELATKQVSSSDGFTFVITGEKQQDIFNTTNQTEKGGPGYEKRNNLPAVLAPVCILIPFICVLVPFLIVRKHRKKKKDARGKETFSNNIANEDNLNETEEEKASSSKAGGNSKVQNRLQLNTDFMKSLCKIKHCGKGIDDLKERILQSPYYDKYAEIISKSDCSTMSVTGHWREDVRIQAAADIFNIKIYVVQMHGEKKTVLFLPKDTDTEIWMKISVDKEDRYNHLSDSDTCNEEEAKLLMYDDVYEIPDQDQDSTELLNGTCYDIRYQK